MVSKNIAPQKNGLEHAGVLDAFAWDSNRNTLVLVMFETRPWDGGEPQLLQLQDKLNAYASFILDGEMTESFPQYQNAPVEIHLRTRHEPDPAVSRHLAQARSQLALQKIGLEIFLIEQPHSTCGCNHSDHKQH